MANRNAIILCSGGIDSVVTGYYAKKVLKYDRITLLFFDYKQRTLSQERFFSKKCAKDLGAEFIEMKICDIRNTKVSLINNKKYPREIMRENLNDTKDESSKYYVPSRNALFLVRAISFLETLKVKERKDYDILVGFIHEINTTFLDTTPKFVKAINQLIKVSTRLKGVFIAPLIKKDKTEVIILGKKLGVDYKKTFSCYIGKNNKHCGVCLSCRIRQEAFYWGNIKDPTEYNKKMKDYRNI
jgi:7-cyano-7-deazaguanine synthase